MFASSICVVLIVLVAAASCLAAAPSLSLGVTGPGVVDGVENMKVVTTLTNTGDETLKLLNDPRTILSALPVDTFTITDSDGASPSFIGVLVKYSPSLAANSTDPSALTVLEPGASVSVTHDLSSTYDFTDTGYTTYIIEASNVFHIVDANDDISEIRATVVDSYVTKLTGGSLTAGAVALSPRATFKGCSRQEEATLDVVIPVATAYAQQAFAYLLTLSPNSSSPRYTAWFGTLTPQRLNIVSDHFRHISASNFSVFTYDCSTCTRDDVFAFVSAADFGTVYLCGQFWRAPLNGTDSQGGTLVHECPTKAMTITISQQASHFTVNGGTSDFAYGQVAALELAQFDPDKAVFNADNHEYFAENNPALP
ncbi:hypothetical protein GSI_03537 [Ganoderma sinense ZZ0214-1]|uniref:Lysine-specific metallo-endopeptidase domain-containing protein n=1 Tax=Ganoderma sinense ZZ0214-1 TaxID=1077348 RepID=A0A2G8SJA3_9APHY|nr:hypothetical protein GSI_03537 [Ganoderma sinense ZZ0214-1]